MKVFVYIGLEIQVYCDFDDLELLEGEVLIKVVYIGICGFDMYVFFGYDECCLVLFILGYEVVGIVVFGVFKGECVIVNLLVIFGESEVCCIGWDNLCLDCEIILMLLCQGGFVEYLSMLVGNFVVVFDYVSDV